MGISTSFRILVVEDNDLLRKSIHELLIRNKYLATSAESATDALELLGRQRFDLVISDYKMAGMNGIELLRKIKQSWPGTDVIIITAYGTIPKGVEAIKFGAFDYLTKPFSNEELISQITALEDQSKDVAVRQNLESKLRQMPEFDAIVGRSEKIIETMAIISKVAKTDATVLIYGESGTGKELVAKSLHALSKRNKCPFIDINCGAIPENLQESELFGHKKGAFTNAHFDKVGLMEMANGGSVFLDEIAETSHSTQVKLLRFLQEKEIRRVGDNHIRKVDVRMIVATNKDLKKVVAKGTFREDLYYRLNVIPISVPPLRERKKDIPILVEHFIKKSSGIQNNKVKRISRQTCSMLLNYPWPGNVRELENVIYRAMALAEFPEITPELLPEEIRSGEAFSRRNAQAPKLAEIESEVILNTLKRMNGHKKKTAMELGISKTTLWRKLKEITDTQKVRFDLE